jgi:hypothetical protein
MGTLKFFLKKQNMRLWIKSWVGLRAILDMAAKIKFPLNSKI